jgi:predicted transcriptional regulator
MRRLGELEAAVMNHVWTREAPVTVREILTDLRPVRPLAYTTVMTVLDNLHRKGWLRRELSGRAYRYTATMTRNGYSAQLMRDALDDAGDPAEALVRFLGHMTPDEATALRSALDAHESQAQP